MTQTRHVKETDENLRANRRKGRFVPVILILLLMVVMVGYTNSMVRARAFSNAREAGADKTTGAAYIIENYMEVAEGVLEVTTDTVEFMVEQGYSLEEIRQYLNREYEKEKELFDQNYSGIYGVINGEYIDGPGWIPPEGYDPKERDWYTLAIAADGETVFTPPYVDAETGKAVITICRKFSSGDNVLALDLEMDYVQQITDSMKYEGKGFGFLMNQDGMIITHADRSKIGLQFGETKEEQAFAREVLDQKAGIYSRNVEGEPSTVFLQPVVDDWVLAFVVHDDDLFAGINVQLLINILICTAIFSLVLLSYLWGRRRERDYLRHLDRLREEEKKREYEATVLRLEKEAADSANHAKSTFLANMSHELRTPMNTVLGLDTMILRESGDEKIKGYALDIQSAAQSQLSIINDILDLSKIESGKMEIIPVEYEVSDLINDVANMITPRAVQKNLRFDLEIDSEIPHTLLGDDVRIRQVLINLLTNAVKYTQEGSVTLSVSGERKGDRERLIFSVRDTGIGIAKEDLEKLFQEYVRIEEKRNRHIEGTGLGISIVTTLLSLMDSKLEVESVYGEGSDFHFTIDQTIVNEEPIGDLEARIRTRATEYHYEASCIIPEARILVVDDNAMNRKVFTELLKDLECAIDEAESGETALSLTKENAYDLIFMDHMMPGMDGIETLRRMRERKDDANQETPVIALTANAVTGAREMYLSKGFDDFLTKPIVPEKLEELILSRIPEEKKKPGKQKTPEPGTGREEADSLPTVEGADFDYALLKLKKASLLRQVVKDYCDLAETDLCELEAYYDALKAPGEEQEASLKAYRIKVHAMKNTAAMTGALAVSALARVLEYASRDRDTETIERVKDVFGKEWIRQKELFSEAFGWAGDTQEDQKPMIDPELLQTYLRALESAMQELDTDTADNVMEELSGYRYDETGEKRLKALAAAVKQLSIEDSLKIIEEWHNA